MIVIGNESGEEIDDGDFDDGESDLSDDEVTERTRVLHYLYSQLIVVL